METHQPRKEPINKFQASNQKKIQCCYLLFVKTQLTDCSDGECDKISDEVLLVNEYNLIWNKSIITGGFRKWRKKVTDAKWKNEILNIIVLPLLRDNVVLKTKDTKDRSYRIKNLLCELPTYTKLLERNTNKIETDLYSRCKKNEKETSEESIYRFGKQLEDNNQNEEIEIL
ncbi:hypothetical protein RhiirC2_794825 [Rhizophagus irregularis]|uniref:Uncharacterized protein n=1 Tax=Rhizophagus irregularis TaxID=588596 RepID=A0A2N1MCR8_9GLOM|nr:hypothetical protein RhiirC2_794825 [Rhizophagus irregularis]